VFDVREAVTTPPVKQDKDDALRLALKGTAKMERKAPGRYALTLTVLESVVAASNSATLPPPAVAVAIRYSEGGSASSGGEKGGASTRPQQLKVSYSSFKGSLPAGLVTRHHLHESLAQRGGVLVEGLAAEGAAACHSCCRCCCCW
jgi:hypothetical protein